jgi:hypothetical protein
METTFRLGNIGVAGELARIHMESGKLQPGCFMTKLGKPFLREYYRTIILAKSTLILCAEQDGRLVGFVSGTMRAEERMLGLRSRRFRLALAALPSVVRHPGLLREAYARQNSGSVETGPGYIVQSGPREEYWAWCGPRSSGSVDMHTRWLAIMKTLGARTVKGEFDRVNATVEKVHSLLGGRFVKEFSTPDGRRRVIVEYTLSGPQAKKMTVSSAQ